VAAWAGARSDVALISPIDKTRASNAIWIGSSFSGKDGGMAKRILPTTLFESENSYPSEDRQSYDP